MRLRQLLERSVAFDTPGVLTDGYALGKMNGTYIGLKLRRCQWQNHRTSPRLLWLGLLGDSSRTRIHPSRKTAGREGKGDQQPRSCRATEPSSVITRNQPRAGLTNLALFSYVWGPAPVTVGRSEFQAQRFACPVSPPLHSGIETHTGEPSEPRRRPLASLVEANDPRSQRGDTSRRLAPRSRTAAMDRIARMRSRCPGRSWGRSP